MKEIKQTKKKPQGYERTRETNPIYQGPYTVTDYLRDRKEGKFTRETELQFILKFQTVPPIERERLEYIDTQAKAQYHGPESWEVGDLWDIPQYLIGNLTGLDYYRVFYELSDQEAIEKRLQQIEDMASYLEIKDKAYHKLDRILKERPDFLEAVNERTAIYSELFLDPTEEDQEIKRATVLLSDYATNRATKEEDYEDLISETYEDIKEETEALRGIMELGDLESMKGTKYRPLVEFMESELTEETFNQSFGQFRATHEGEGIQGARLRILRTVLYGFFYPIYRGDLFESEGGIGILKEICEGSIQKAISKYETIEELGKTSNILAIDRPKTTLEIARKDPLVYPEKFVITHSYLDAKIGTPEFSQLFIDDNFGASLIYKRGKPGAKEIRNIIRIEGKEETSEDRARYLTLTSLFKAKNPDSFKNKDLRFEPIRISETEFLQAHYQTKTEFKREDLDDLYTWITEKMSTFVSIDMNESIDQVPGLREALSRNFPGEDAGIVDRPQLKLEKIRYSINPRKNADGEKTKTRQYYFEAYPITIYYGMLLGQYTLADMSLWETPTLEEKGGMNPRVLEKVNQLEKEGTKLWTINEGKRSISLKRDPQIPSMKCNILTQIGINSTPGTIGYERGEFPLNLTKI